MTTYELVDEFLQEMRKHTSYKYELKDYQVQDGSLIISADEYVNGDYNSYMNFTFDLLEYITWVYNKLRLS